MRGGQHPRPSEVPGFDRARAAGILPHVPAMPPRLEVRPSARATFAPVPWFALGIIALPLAINRVLGSVLPSPAVTGLGLAAALGLVVAVVLRLRSVGDQALAEFLAGYTTLPLTLGTFWFDADPGGWLHGFRIGWDHSALWRLDGHGRVLSPPQRRDDPPGMYPSPTHPGNLELWTGSQWGYHRARSPVVETE